jgi:hypothetical protein
VSRSRELLSALLGAQAGGHLASPPGFDGELGLGIPGVSGVSRGRTWDAAASARAPDLTGETVTFVALPDGTLVVDVEVPDDSLAPVADAIEEFLAPPYRAAAVRNEEDVWSAVAERIDLVELPGLEGNTVDLSVVAGIRELKVDDEPTVRSVASLDALVEEQGDVAVHGERVDGDLFAVDVFPL